MNFVAIHGCKEGKVLTRIFFNFNVEMAHLRSCFKSSRAGAYLSSVDATPRPEKKLIFRVSWSFGVFHSKSPETKYGLKSYSNELISTNERLIKATLLLQYFVLKIEWPGIGMAASFYSSVDFTDASHIKLSTDERNKTTPWWINHTTWHLF